MLFTEEQHPACSGNERTRRQPFPVYPGGGRNPSQAFNLACFIQVLSVTSFNPKYSSPRKRQTDTGEPWLGVEFLSQACVRLTMEARTLEKENSSLHNRAKGVVQEEESQVGPLRKRLGAVFRSSIDHPSSGSHLRAPHIRSVSCQQA